MTQTMLGVLARVVVAGAFVALGAIVTRSIFSETFRRLPGSDGAGSVVLRAGRGVWALGIVCGILVPLGLGWVAVFHPPILPGQMQPLIGLLVGFGLLGLSLLAAAARVWARVTPRGIEAQHFFGSVQQLAWDQMMSVRYSALRGALIFDGRQGEQVRVSIMAVGLPVLMEQMRAHLPQGLYEEALSRGLAQLGVISA
jgi:hypothetical protein